MSTYKELIDAVTKGWERIEVATELKYMRFCEMVLGRKPPGLTQEERDAICAYRPTLGRTDQGGEAREAAGGAEGFRLFKPGFDGITCSRLTACEEERCHLFGSCHG